MDLQGWGESVATAGYGALFDPGDARQRYTAYFSGTSSASPIVAGAVAAVQGALLAQGMDPLAPAEIRELLVSTGTPQPEPDAQTPIGPLPNIAAALETLPEPHGVPGLASGGALLALLSRRRARRRHLLRERRDSDSNASRNAFACADRGTDSASRPFVELLAATLDQSRGS